LVQAASVSIHKSHGQYIENIHLQTYESENHFWDVLYKEQYSKIILRAEEFLDGTGGPGEDALIFIRSDRSDKNNIITEKSASSVAEWMLANTSIPQCQGTTARFLPPSTIASPMMLVHSRKNILQESLSAFWRGGIVIGR
jgi:hypothetical protein